MRHTIILIAILAGAASWAAWGLESPAGGPFTFQFRQEGDCYYFDGRFAVDTDPKGAWEVLTDYNHLSRFVANMNCRVLNRDGDELMVDQTVGGGFLFIRQEVKGLLKIREKPYESIYLEEVKHRQFGLYQGSWNLLPVGLAGRGVTVTYRLEAERNSATPGFVTPGLFRQAAEDLVIGMKKEMDRRETAKRMNGLRAGKADTGS